MRQKKQNTRQSEDESPARKNGGTAAKKLEKYKIVDFDIFRLPAKLILIQRVFKVCSLTLFSMSRESNDRNQPEMISISTSHTHKSYLSPGLMPSSSEADVAMELKFLMPVERANTIRARAIQELARDPYSSSSSDGYQVCSLYLDTPNFDVLHRNAELNGTKYRFRQYGESTQLFLERKQRVSGAVQKKRQSLSKENLEDYLDEENELCSEIRSKLFQPSCAVRYQRDAFYDPKGNEVCRATFDYNLSVDIFVNRTWEELVAFLDNDLTPRNSAQHARSQFLFHDWAVVEFKFINSLPLRLKLWVEEYQMVPMNFSKYRSAMVVGFDG